MKHLDIKLVEKAFTHGGVFHADDVFSAALLLILNPAIQIERGVQVPENYEGLVFDIGGGAYDHHQRDARVRENGVPYAAFGLLWDAYGIMLLAKEDVHAFDEEFVQMLDQSDNTGEANPISRCVSDFLPQWDDQDADMDQRFFQAVEWAMHLLERKFQTTKSEREAYQKVREMLQTTACQDGILCMEKMIPWKKALKGTDIDYVIFPSLRGGYMIQAVPEDEDEMRSKCPFPEEWRGRTPQELKRITGVATIQFCHNSGFLCVAETYEDARNIAIQSYLTNEMLSKEPV